MEAFLGLHLKLDLLLEGTLPSWLWREPVEARLMLD